MPPIQPDPIKAESCGFLNGGIMMEHNYRAFYGFNNAPFGTDIKASDILKTPELIDVQERFGYVICYVSDSLTLRGLI